jgi:type VI secretion system VgrG family protein
VVTDPRRSRFAPWLLRALLLAVAFSAQAASAPSRLHYQGVLRDASDQPLDGQLSMTFRFFDAETGGNEILVDTHAPPLGVPVVGGLFGVELGGGQVSDGGANLPGDPYLGLEQVFRDFADVWMEIVIEGETLAPRVRLLSSAYALNADHVDGKDGSELLDTSATAQTKIGDLTLGGDLTLSAGNPAPGKVLTSDASGTASWQEAPGTVAARVEALADLLDAEQRRLAFDAQHPLSCGGPLPAQVSFSVAGVPTGVAIGFAGSDRVSEMFDYRVAIETATALDPAEQIGQPAELVVERGGATTRFQGTIVEFGLAAFDGETSTYVARLRPAISLLERRSGYGIHQNQSIPDVVSAVLSGAGLSANQLLAGPHPPLEMVTQWKESELDFVSRLLEEEGIHFHFEQGPSTEALVLGDVNAAFDTLPVGVTYQGHLAPPPAGVEQISTFHAPRRRYSETLSLGGYDFFTAGAFFQSATLAGGSGEIYEYDPGLSDPAQAGARAGVAAEREEVRSSTGSGTGNVADFRAGQLFSLNDASGANLDGSYLIVEVSHVLVRGADDCWSYGNEFRVLPGGVSFRPARTTPKPVIPGPSTATVTGPAGATTHVDAYGRVKVRFHWDRDGPVDENSSAWVRVATPVGGTDAGSFVPEVGDEVLVGFVEGDPDRPLVVGSLYNGVDTPPTP